MQAAFVSVVAPDLGSEGPARVSAWLVDVGDSVRAGDRLVELLLPGVTYDVHAPVTGRLLQAHVPLNAVVRPGDTLGQIEADESV